MVMMCIGTRANTRWQMGKSWLTGIVADTSMRTNMPDIYCAGDCCEVLTCRQDRHRSSVYGITLLEQGRTAGANMAGVKTVYPGNLLHNITHFMGMDFIDTGM